MDTMHAHDVAVEAREVFSLPALLDQSAALAAAQRLYVQNRAGLRFFCENRRVVSVDEARAMEADSAQYDAASAEVTDADDAEHVEAAGHADETGHAGIATHAEETAHG